MTKRGKQYKDLIGESLTNDCIVKLSRHSKNAYLWRRGRKYLHPINGADKVLIDPLLQTDNTMSVIKISDSFEDYQRLVTGS